MEQSASSGVVMGVPAPGGGRMARKGGAERLRRELREIKAGVRQCSLGLDLLTLQLNLIEARTLQDRREGVCSLAAPLAMILFLSLMYVYVTLYGQAIGADQR
ncbi:hypothetical protein ZWY2020_006480 [Hordeum vulgare]|nr:hypothetical protein ZWY2020_006480 [Hordeum vulgare]